MAAEPTVDRQRLSHPGGTTEIFVGAGAMAAAGEELGRWTAGRTLFVVSSPPVLACQGAALDGLRRSAARTVMLEVADGEAAKSLAEAERLWRAMLEGGGKRDSRLACFGGGSVGDLGGFVAGCFLRGIDFVQLPTTLLAQVDAAVGGKSGVDLPEGKNTVGLFHHPAFVVADTGCLSTLGRAELRAGLAEVVKMAYLLDPELLAAVEARLEELLDGDPEALAPVVAAAVAAKRRVVEDDPEEGGRRRLLNFGHTLAHAVEAELGYAGLRHGDAVSYGMLFALRLARRRGLPAADAERLRRLLERFELPPLPALDSERLVARMGRDKKATEGGLVWVLPRRLGAGEQRRDVGAEEVAAELGRFLAAPLAP